MKEHSSLHLCKQCLRQGTGLQPRQTQVRCVGLLSYTRSSRESSSHLHAFARQRKVLLLPSIIKSYSVCKSLATLLRSTFMFCTGDEGLPSSKGLAYEVYADNLARHAPDVTC